MRYKFLTVPAVALAIAGAMPTEPAAAAAACPAVDQQALGLPFVYRHGLPGKTLQREFFAATGLKGKGYRPRRLTGYLAGGKQRFATRWVKAAGSTWSSRFGLRGDDAAGSQKKFHDYFLEMKSGGFRPLDVSGYNTKSGDVRYAAVWEKGTGGPKWRIHRDVTRAGMQALVDAYEPTGWTPVRVEGYRLDGELHFISIWEKRSCDWRMHNRMTRERYQQRFDDYKDELRLVHLDAYREGSGHRYAGIWWKQPGPEQAVRSNRDWYLFQRHFNNLGCAGYVLENGYAAETSSGGVRHGGIWTFHAQPQVGAGSPLSDRVRKQVDCAPGRAGAAVINATTGETIMVHPDQVFGAASASKIPILYAVLREVDRSGLTLDTAVDVGSQFGANAGVQPVRESTCATSPTATQLRANQSYSIRCLAQLMIRVSHNWATNRLVELVGMDAINAELDALGMTLTRIRRYMRGTGAPSVHGLGNPVDDYEAGWDNVSTPRELATFMQRLHVDGLVAEGSPLKLLSPESNQFFWATLGLDADGGVNTKSYFPSLLGNIPSWSSKVTVFNKPGGNTWTDDDYAHKPQLGPHRQASEGGRLSFANGQVVYYAMFVDEADHPAPSPDHQDAIKCTGLAVVAEYSATPPASVPAVCQ